MKTGISLNLRIDWSELDLFGHVNNVAFMKYIQSARVNCWDKIGISTFYETQNNGPMLAKTECTFLKPLFYPGNVRIETQLAFIKTTSFAFDHHIYNEHNEISAKAHDIMVMYDFNTGQKMEIPNEMRTALENM
jgi:acyl-CoA thioester hydrolase